MVRPRNPEILSPLKKIQERAQKSLIKCQYEAGFLVRELMVFFSDPIIEQAIELLKEEIKRNLDLQYELEPQIEAAFNYIELLLLEQTSDQEVINKLNSIEDVSQWNTDLHPVLWQHIKIKSALRVFFEKNPASGANPGLWSLSIDDNINRIIRRVHAFAFWEEAKSICDKKSLILESIERLQKYHNNLLEQFDERNLYNDIVVASSYFIEALQVARELKFIKVKKISFSYKKQSKNKGIFILFINDKEVLKSTGQIAYQLKEVFENPFKEIEIKDLEINKSSAPHKKIYDKFRYYFNRFNTRILKLERFDIKDLIEVSSSIKVNGLYAPLIQPL
jgi:hypothetical protein